MSTEGGGLARDVHQAFSQTFLASTGEEAAAYAAEMLLELLASPEEVADAAAAQTAADPLLSLQHLVALAMPQAQQEEVEVAALRLLDRDVLRRAEAETEVMQQVQAQQQRTVAATTPGTDVLALLPQDGEYHPATVVCRAKTQVAPVCEDTSSSGASGSGLGATAGRKGRRAAAKAAAAAVVQQQESTSARSAGASAKRNGAVEAGQDVAVVVNFFEFGGLEVTVPLAKIIPLSEDSEGGDDDEDAGSGSCELCSRDSVRLTRHHLRPRQLHARLLAQGVGRETLNLTTNLCRSCHSMVHRSESNMDLALKFNTIEALRAHPVLARWAVYAARLRTGTKWDHAILVSQKRR
jgi:hypothetical protein